MKNNNLLVTIFGLLLLGICTYIVLAGNPGTREVSEHATELGRDAIKEVKSGVRKIQDEACELVDGKVECAAQRAKHAAQNAADEVEDSLN